MANGKLRIEMLGLLRVTVSGETAVFRTDAQRVLLAYLAALLPPGPTQKYPLVLANRLFYA